MYVTKDSTGLIQIWNTKPIKFNDEHKGFIYGSHIEKGIEVNDIHEFFKTAEKGMIKKFSLMPISEDYGKNSR